MVVKFLMGFDTEAPYGEFFYSEKGKVLKEKTLSTVGKMNVLLDSYNVSRTYFLLGDFLEKLSNEFSSEELKNIFDSNNELVDLQQHAYSHNVFKKINIRPDKKPLTFEEIQNELFKTSLLIKTIFNKEVIGVRPPLGYSHGFEDSSEIVDLIKNNDLKYVSSDLRSSSEFILAHLLENENLRQPKFYENGVLEIPSHGWHDTAFIGSKTKGVPDFSKLAKKELENYIFNHYKDLIIKAKKFERDIYLGGCFHPQVICEYDNNLEVFRNICDYALENKVEIMSYTQAYQEITLK